MSLPSRALFVLASMLGCSLFAISAWAQEEFDGLTLVAPRGWTRDASPHGETLRFTREDAAGSAFAMITLYRSVPAGPDARINFATAWAELVRKPLGAKVPQMSPVKQDNGWEVQSGSSLFQQDRLSGVVLLVSASAANKMNNLLLVSNTTIFQSEIQEFLASLQRSAVGKSPAGISAPPSTPIAGEKAEVWYSYRATLGSFTYHFTFMAVFPNGDALASIPSEGMLGINRATRPQYRWGKRRVSGNEIQFDYGEFGLSRMGSISDEKMSYPAGSKSSFYYRLKPVDDLKVEGEYASDSPDWHQKGKSPDIVFRSDGTFVNYGILTEIYDATGKQTGTKYRGSGTYDIRDFTIVFKYSDGTVARRPFYLSVTGSGGPVTNALLMGDFPYYRRKD